MGDEAWLSLFRRLNEQCVRNGLPPLFIDGMGVSAYSFAFAELMLATIDRLERRPLDTPGQITP